MYFWVMIKLAESRTAETNSSMHTWHTRLQCFQLAVTDEYIDLCAMQ